MGASPGRSRTGAARRSTGRRGGPSRPRTRRPRTTAPPAAAHLVGDQIEQAGLADARIADEQQCRPTRGSGGGRNRRLDDGAWRVATDQRRSVSRRGCVVCARGPSGPKQPRRRRRAAVVAVASSGEGTARATGPPASTGCARAARRAGVRADDDGAVRSRRACSSACDACVPSSVSRMRRQLSNLRLRLARASQAPQDSDHVDVRGLGQGIDRDPLAGPAQRLVQVGAVVAAAEARHQLGHGCNPPARAAARALRPTTRGSDSRSAGPGPPAARRETDSSPARKASVDAAAAPPAEQRAHRSPGPPPPGRR